VSNHDPPSLQELATESQDISYIVLVSYRWHVSMVVHGHRHGVLQLLSNWADGTAYISQCPLGFGETFTHRFRVTGQTGTILWHAHITWLRATLYGPLIIRPQDDQPYPWDPQPVSSIPILVGTSLTLLTAI
jgi:laccase